MVLAKQSDLKNEKLAGKVKQIKYEEYDASEYDGKITMERPKKNKIRVVKYNENGNMTESLTLNNSGGVIYKELYKYDNNSNKIQVDIYQGSEVLSWIAFLKYDENGNKIEQVMYKPSTNVEEFVTYFKYDNIGKLIEEYSPVKSTKLKYDSLGNCIEKGIYNGKILTKRFFYKQDENKNIVETLETDASRNPINKYNYKYNTNGLIVERLNFHGKANKFECKDVYTYEYDNLGNCIKKISRENGNYTVSIYEIQYY